jgi:thiol-disulfide isomerase/thioredoxin
MTSKAILASLLLLLLLQATPGAAETYDYQLNDLDGNLHRVSDHRGKWIVINFWASWCPPCLHEMPELERFYQAHKSSAVVWGVTFEDADKGKFLNSSSSSE